MAAYTHVSSGTPVTLNASGAIAPTGSSVVSGNLLLLVTGARAASQTVSSAPTGWTLLSLQTTSTTIAVYARIATGGADDNPSITWSGTSYRYGWVEQFSGDVYTDLATIIDGTAANTGGSSETTLPAPAASAPSSNDCLLILFSAKQKTATGNGSTFTPPGSFTERRELCEDGTRVAAGFASWQQTTATSFDGTDWTKNTGTDEATLARSVLIALKTEVPTTLYVKLLAEAAAASAASIEGVVLNAARDTVIGEFTGQAFEATLESGEAVLLIPVADITPDGSTLTTSDTPIVFAYNATDSIIGPGSATVIEV